jgi:cell division protease FtsH
MQRDCSEQTAQIIDAEVKKILDSSYDTARKILRDHRDQLDLVANELLKRESLDAEAFYGLLGKPVPTVKEHAAHVQTPTVT